MIYQIITNHSTESDIHRSEEILNHVETNIINRIYTLLNTMTNTHCDPLLIQEDIINACQADQQYQALLKTIFSGFPKSKKDLDPLLHDFWPVHDWLFAYNNIALFDQHLVIPKAFRKYILSVLHLAHQGVTNVQARANATIPWPGMNASIRNTRYTCQKCNEHSPSQSQEPVVPIPTPGYPFQKVCADYFEAQWHSYLTYVDCFSGQMTVFHFKPHQTTSQSLISECCSLFENYGPPEEFSSDGGA